MASKEYIEGLEKLEKKYEALELQSHIALAVLLGVGLVCPLGAGIMTLILSLIR